MSVRKFDCLRYNRPFFDKIVKYQTNSENKSARLIYGRPVKFGETSSMSGLTAASY